MTNLRAYKAVAIWVLFVALFAGKWAVGCTDFPLAELVFFLELAQAATWFPGYYVLTIAGAYLLLRRNTPTPLKTKTLDYLGLFIPMSVYAVAHSALGVCDQSREFGKLGCWASTVGGANLLTGAIAAVALCLALQSRAKYWLAVGVSAGAGLLLAVILSQFPIGV